MAQCEDEKLVTVLAMASSPFHSKLLRAHSPLLFWIPNQAPEEDAFIML